MWVLGNDARLSCSQSKNLTYWAIPSSQSHNLNSHSLLHPQELGGKSCLPRYSFWVVNVLTWWSLDLLHLRLCKSPTYLTGLREGQHPLSFLSTLGSLHSAQVALWLSHGFHDPGWQIGDTLNWMLKKLCLLHNGSSWRVIAVYCNTQTVPLTRMMGGCSTALLLAKDLTNMLCKWKRSNRANI